jgi:uncharacterized protein YxjI
MASPPPADGWVRYLVKTKLAVGRDFTVLDPASEEQRYLVDGSIGPRPKVEVRDAADRVIARGHGKLLGIPRRFTITDPDGVEVATLTAKAFSGIRHRMTLETAAGQTWSLEGNLLEREYTATSDGRPVVHVTQKWAAVRDTFALDVTPDVDVGTALIVLWAIDRWVEQR